MDWKNRFKNYGFWIAVASLLLLTLDHQFDINFVKEEYSALSNGILTILTLIGIINNPTTNSRGFCDDQS